MDKITQEFYCNDCDGYFRVKLNMALNRRVEIVCPNCKHHHPRGIKDGRIVEAYSPRDASTEEICPPKSAYSKESIAIKMMKNARDGVVIACKEDLRKEGSTRNPQTDAMLRELWLEFHGGGE